MKIYPEFELVRNYISTHVRKADDSGDYYLIPVSSEFYGDFNDFLTFTKLCYEVLLFRKATPQDLKDEDQRGERLRFIVPEECVVPRQDGRKAVEGRTFREMEEGK